MKKIGFLFEYSTLNGGENSILAVLKQLSDQHLSPVILAPSAGPLAERCRDVGLNHIPFQLADYRSNPELLSTTLNDLIDRHQLQLVHANSLSAGRKLGEVAAKINCPTTSHLRDIMSLSRPAIAALGQHRGLIAVSHATRNFHIQQGLQSENLVVIHNGIDLRQFRPRSPSGSLHEELQLPSDTIFAAVIGQICLRKGHHDVAQAAVMLKEKWPNLHFVIVGQRHSTKQESIDFDDQLTGIFHSARMEDRLHRIGWRNDLPALYPEFRLLVHAARQEPLGRVLLEAAASGIPIVATHVGGTEEILTHKKSAWFVSPADPVGLAEGIDQLLSNSELSAQFSAQGRRTIEERFTIEQAASHHLEFWTGILSTA